MHRDRRRRGTHHRLCSRVRVAARYRVEVTWTDEKRRRQGVASRSARPSARRSTTKEGIMKTGTALVMMLASAVGLAPGTPARSEEGPPAWAYPVNTPDFKLPPDDGTPRRVPGSDAALTLTPLRDRFFAPGWHPCGHSPLPGSVSPGPQ